MDPRETVRTLIESFGSHDVEARLGELVSDDYREHAPRRAGPADRAALGRDIHTMFTAFPDFTPTIEMQLAEGDLVASRVTWRGTHTGPMAGIEPTGASVAVTVHRIDRVVDGKVTESWLEFDPFAVPHAIGATDPLRR